MREECPTCSHDEHEIAKCKRCNCGQSEVVHGRYYPRFHETDYAESIENIYEAVNPLKDEKGDYKLCQ